MKAAERELERQADNLREQIEQINYSVEIREATREQLEQLALGENV